MWEIIKRWRVAAFVFSVGCVLAFVFPRSVHALRLDPGVLDVAVNPGETTDATFVFTNTSSEEKTYSVELMRVTLGSAEGDLTAVSIEEPSMMPPGAPEDPANWFSDDADSITLAAGASQNITVHIHPPASVSAQVFVLGIRLIEQGAAGSNIAVHDGAIELAFVSIGKGLSPDLRILSFAYPPHIISFFPQQAAITFRNEGNGVAIPDGSVVVKNLLGFTVGVFPLNVDGKRIPPGQTRTWSVATPVSAWFNVYSVALVGGAANGEAMIGTAHRVVIVSPWVIGGILVGAILFVVVLRRRRRQQK